MSETDVLPELEQIGGAALRGEGLSFSGGCGSCLRQVAEDRGGVYRDFAEVTDADIVAALNTLRDQLRTVAWCGLTKLQADFRMENEVNCGP
ncbi:MAG: hypothetical protein M9935_11185 [Kiritimatiellae bacterium]|nr:hypothetical protein [Kiritimatiellia bacterium]